MGCRQGWQGGYWTGCYKMSGGWSFPFAGPTAFLPWFWLFISYAYWHTQPIPSSFSIRLSSSYLNISASHIWEWERYRIELCQAGIQLSENSDLLTWGGMVLDGNISVKDIYAYITKDLRSVTRFSWLSKQCKQAAPLKLKCFLCLVLHNRILTWENLYKRGFQRPGICPMCGNASEETLHLYLSCHFAREIWFSVLHHFNINIAMDYYSIKVCLTNWMSQLKEFHMLPL